MEQQKTELFTGVKTASFEASHELQLGYYVIIICKKKGLSMIATTVKNQKMADFEWR